MYQVQEESLNKMLDVGQKLYAKLAASPFFALLKGEPEIMEFINAYRDVESQIKRQNAAPETTP
jgi:hypothetical protein